MSKRKLAGFSAFAVVWLGQLLSVVGTRMTNFSVSIWVWDSTGRATDFAFLLFFSFAATVLFSPIAGALIDRWNRKLTLILSDLGSAVATTVLLVLFATGTAQIWQLYLINFATGVFLAFQTPVYSATISIMVERGQYPRANAMMFFVRYTPGLFAPALATTLLAASNITAVLVVDIVSYLVAIVTVLAVGIPTTPKSEDEPPRLMRDSISGFTYILRHPQFFRFESLLLAINIIASIGFVLLRPVVLARTGNSATDVGVVITTGAFGGVVGAIVLGTLRSPKDKMLRVLLGILLFSIVGRILYGFTDVVALMAISIGVVAFCIPIVDGYTNSIYQEKVQPSIQGRVFAARVFIEDLTVPLATVIAGPLVDHVLTPYMQPGHHGAELFGRYVGTGAGGAFGLIFVTIGVLGVFVAVAGFLSPNIRRIETLVPDHGSVSGVTSAKAETSGEPTPGTDAPATAASVTS
jgi:DHA3 family macrolide efflux protein-like MFS transporter